MSTLVDEVLNETRLSCNKVGGISRSRKKSVGLTTGDHLVAGFDESILITDVPEAHFIELVRLAHEYAHNHATLLGQFRIGFNGRHLGRRNHAHVHIMLPDVDDKLPRIVDGENDTTPTEHVWQGMLYSGKKWLIERSRKKAPGLYKGRHYIMQLKDNPIDVVRMTQADFMECMQKALDFARTMSFGTERYRIVYNGPYTGTLHFGHFHIILPEEGDELPPFVERNEEAHDTVK